MTNCTLAHAHGRVIVSMGAGDVARPLRDHRGSCGRSTANTPRSCWSYPSAMSVSTRALIMLSDLIRHRRTELGT